MAWADVSVSVGGLTVADDGGPSTAATFGLNFAIASNNSDAQAFGPDSEMSRSPPITATPAPAGYLILPGSFNSGNRRQLRLRNRGLGFPSIGNTSHRERPRLRKQWRGRLYWHRELQPSLHATNNSYAAAGGGKLQHASPQATAVTAVTESNGERQQRHGTVRRFGSA